ncbi:MAG: nickel-dependent lactate racemase [Lachnospiraceae bacterium]|nr:nickel-dependent lactate racemase [Lachnospiraceae bacterium]
MSEIRLPYGTGSLPCRAPEERIDGIVTSRICDYVPAGSPDELVRTALENPIGSEPLSELAKGKEKVVILASDHTRPVPSRVIMPQMLSEIRKGNPDAEITILIATGCHRGTRREELIGKFGEEIAETETIAIHDCDDSEMADLGTLPSGGPLIVNRLVKEADLVAAEGFIEPHFFAGFSGGRKSVLPGIAARKVVLANHNGAFIADPHSRTGILSDNPIHRDMIYAGEQAGLAFVVNVVLNEQHDVIYAVAGDMQKAHLAGCEFLESHCRVEAGPSDIVITSNGGYPMDQNVYQSVKGMTAAEAAVKPGGVIIIAAKCEDGVGGDSFYQTFADERDLTRMTDGFVATPPEETRVDQWESQILARVLTRAHVIFVSDLEDEIVRNFQMTPAKDIEGALKAADEILGNSYGRITVIPDGMGVIVKGNS